MPVAGAAEAVTVSGDAALDSRKTETGATYDQKELESIPTTRDVWAVLRQIPGVLLDNVNVGGEDSGTQPAFVGKGSHPDQNTYNLDGVGDHAWAASRRPIFNFDSLDNIEVATGGSDPSLPTPGVTLNLVTKRGTNQILGSARALYTGRRGWDYGAEAGGPLWKDRLWLWGAGGRLAFVGQDGVPAPAASLSSASRPSRTGTRSSTRQLAPGQLAHLFLHRLRQGEPGTVRRSGPLPTLDLGQMFTTDGRTGWRIRRSCRRISSPRWISPT